MRRIGSGGQTGIDLAGGIAGFALGIDVIMTLPAGFLQRHADGVDKRFTEEDIRRQVEEGAAALIELEQPPSLPADDYPMFL